MSKVTGADLRAVLALVGEAHDTEDLDDFRAFLLPALQRLVPCEYASYNEIRGDGEIVAALVYPDLPPAFMEAWSRHALGNPLVTRFARTRDGRPYRFSDVLDKAELDRLPFIREFLRPLGAQHQIAFALPSAPGFVRGIALVRGGEDFTNREREMLDLARPHLVQAYRNAVLRGRAAAVTGARADTLERLGDPAAVLDEEGRVAYATPEAERLLRELGGRVNAPLPPALRGADGQLEPFVVERDGAPLLLRPLRLRRQGQHVLLFESDRDVERSALVGLGLPPRESEILAGFAAGRAPGEIARELRISVRTVHKHTQRIHAKLGTRDRAQAVATAYTAVRTSA